MNWFQIVFLCEQSQDAAIAPTANAGCELISNCIFVWAITRVWLQFHFHILLWIDFKLYFCVSNHKFLSFYKPIQCVVNWFQIVFLCEQSQVHSLNPYYDDCCELISNCIFVWAITRSIPKNWVISIVWDFF